MEEKVRNLNKKLQEKMRQRVKLSAEGTKVENNVKNSSYPSNCLTADIRTADCIISTDYYSDSGVHTSSTVIRSARNSPSENEV